MKPTLDFVFSQLPGPNSEFIEVEIQGRSISTGGVWREAGGFHLLGLTADDLRELADQLDSIR